MKFEVGQNDPTVHRISSDLTCPGRCEGDDPALCRVHEQRGSDPFGGFDQPQVGHDTRGLFKMAPRHDELLVVTL